MSIVFTRLVSAQTLTNGNVTYYTSPTNVTTRILNATICNTSAGTIKATVYLVPSAGAAGVGNEVLAAVPVGPGLTYPCPDLIGKALKPGDFVVAKDDTGAVSGFDVSGFQIS